MAVIYEVNLSIDSDIEQQYLDWLRPHIKEILHLKGFHSAELLKREEENPAPGTTFWTVQYRLASRADLQNYFDQHASAMREDGLKRFGGKFQAARRVLVVTQQF